MLFSLNASLIRVSWEVVFPAVKSENQNSIQWRKDKKSQGQKSKIEDDMFLW